MYVLGARERENLSFLHDASTRTKARQRSSPLANVGAGRRRGWDEMGPRQICYVIWLGRSVTRLPVSGSWRGKLCVLELGRRTNFSGRESDSGQIEYDAQDSAGVIHVRAESSLDAHFIFNKEKSAVLHLVLFVRRTKEVGEKSGTGSSRIAICKPIGTAPRQAVPFV